MSLTKRFDQSSTAGTDLGLLVLRVGLGLSLFIRHGLEKLTGWGQMVQHFPDPVHIGRPLSLGFALFSDAICAVLIVLGLWTRPAALIILINLLVAFFLVHHAAFLRDDHSELVVVYIVGFATLLLAGPGRWSAGGK